MLGRGVDQILAHPSAPLIHETWARSALDYVALAEAASGPIPRRVSADYPWGEALPIIALRRPAVRLINLETSVTTSATAWPKGINYRMHPRNVDCLTAARVDCCVLANNHVLDWGREGLLETLDTLHAAGITTVGAGRDEAEAEAPAILHIGHGERVLVFAAATDGAGVPRDWAACGGRAGVARLPDLSDATLRRVVERMRPWCRPSDRIVFSLHWGGNWGFDVPQAQRRFARGLIDDGAVDLVHGHSSHHVKGFEIHRGRLVLYGCGDLLNDYEGISGRPAYRGDLGLLYFATLAASGRLEALELVPTCIRRFRIERATGADRQWLASVVKRECAQLDPDGEFSNRVTLAPRC